MTKFIQYTNGFEAKRKNARTVLSFHDSENEGKCIHLSITRNIKNFETFNRMTFHQLGVGLTLESAAELLLMFNDMLIDEDFQAAVMSKLNESKEQ